MDVTTLVYIDAAGYHFADYPTFLAFVQGSYQGIYGADVYLGADSMDGQWTAILAQALYDTAALGASVYASFSPATAQGVGLSKAVKINGLNRDVPTNSTVVLTIVGVAGTQITNGIAVDTLNQQWLLPSPTTIPSGGSINVTATAQNEGAVQAADDTVTGIFTPTNGWQTVNNAAPASPGAPVEQDGALRGRQAVSTANPSLTVLEGTAGALANVPGVTASAVWENFLEMSDANSQVANSIFAVVQGGTLAAVAQAIQIHKTPGTRPWAGGGLSSGNRQSQVVYDSRGVPITIGFYQPPDPAEIQVQVTITIGNGWAASFEQVIANQLAAFINALGIGSGQQFGGYVRVYPLIPLTYVPNYVPSMYTVNSVEIGINSGGVGTADLAISFTELPSCNPTFVSANDYTDVTFVL